MHPASPFPRPDPRRRTGAARLLAAAAVLAVMALTGCGGGSNADGASSTGAATAGATTFSRSYGGPDHDEAQAVARTSDGGIVFVGAHGGDSRGAATDLWLSKLDANGNVEWERAIGGRAVDSPQRLRTLRAVRRTADGGYVVGGITSDRPPEEGRPADPTPTGNDAWVAKFNAAGLLEWQRDVDSGTWEGYDFASPAFGRGAYADEFDPVVRQLPDGGYIGAGLSEANLVPPGEGGTVRMNELSVLVFRLDAQGNLLWRRRLPGGSLQPRLAPTADNGALLAYQAITEAGATLRVLRLGSDGGTVWQVEEDEHPQPADALQTGDLGFLVASRGGGALLLKLDPNGFVQWRNEYDDRDLYHVDESCAPDPNGAPPCEIHAAGSLQGEGLVMRLSAAGRTLQERRFPDSGSLGDLLGADGTAALVVIQRGGATGARRLVLDRATLATVAASSTEIPDSAALASPTEIIATSTPGQRWRRYVAPTLLGDALDLAQTVTPALYEGEDDPVAVVELAPGSYVIAGNSNSFDRDGGNWVIRMTDGRVDWQRRYPDAGIALGLARSGDGVVMAVSGARGTGLLHLAADGSVLRQSQRLYGIPATAGELHALADGGHVFAGSSAPSSGLADTLVARFDAEGRVLWARRSFPFALLAATSIDPVDDDGDGVRDDGFVLAGPPAGTDGAAAGLADVLRLDAQGEVLWARRYRIPGASVAAPHAVKVRQARDGGYVLATTDVAALAPEGLGQPFGQSNVLLVRLDRDGTVAWTRSYGALLDERLRDLQVLPDGGLLVAGGSDSLGDRSDAWLLRLGPDGLLAEGCNAHLGSLPAAGVASEPLQIGLDVSSSVDDAPADLPAATDTAASAIALSSVVARQCLGAANPPDDPDTPPAPPQPVLTVAQPQRTGVVISTPPGLACGTAASAPPCGAPFPAGSDVFLEVEIGSAARFVRWEGCDELTGPGPSGVERCHVRMTGDRTVGAVFADAPAAPPAPPPGGRFTLTVVVEGLGGFVGSTDGSFSCGTSAFRVPRTCAVEYEAGRVVDLYAAPLPGSNVRLEAWGGDCADFGAQMNVRLTMDRNHSCRAAFVTAPS